MEEKNKIYEALGKLPELVDSINSLIEENEKKDAFLAKMAETKVEAQMSEAGKQEIVELVEKTIKETPCATPDVAESSTIIANQVLGKIDGSVRHTVEEVVKSTPITLEHHHTHIHATTYELRKYADDASKKWLLILSIVCGLLFTILVGGTYWFYNSEYYWGKEYSELFHSKFTTEKEKDMLWENVKVVVLLPREFKTNPEFVKAKIRQNKSVLEEREKQATRNKGKFSTDIPLERK